MEQITGEADTVWHSNRSSMPDLDLDSLPESDMSFVDPMQCKLVTELPEGNGWQYEVKWDGYRALAIRSGSRVSLVSRRNRSLADQFPEVVKALESLEDGTILDGEIVALNSTGKPSFHLLQNYASEKATIVYYAFDQLAYRRKDLSGLPLSKRSEVLEVTLSGIPDPLRRSAILQASAQRVIQAVKSKDWKVSLRSDPTAGTKRDRDLANGSSSRRARARSLWLVDTASARTTSITSRSGTMPTTA